MPFNIDVFKDNAGKDGFLKSNKFELIIPTLPSALSVDPETARNLRFMCDATSLPGIMHSMNENRRFGYGPVERKPFAPTFNDLMVDILVDGKSNTWRVFYKWLQLVMNSSIDTLNTGDRNTGLNTFEVNYKSVYRKNIELDVYNDIGEISTKIIFNEAFPTSIMERPLNWGSTELLRIQTNWTFHTWYTT